MTRPNTLKCIIAITLVTIFSQATVVACPFGATPEERVLWETHNCSDNYRNWFRSNFNLQSDHWSGGWGWDNCDWQVEFGKMLDAGVLLTFGFEVNMSPWHSNDDYIAWAGGSQHDFRYEPKEVNGNAAAKAFKGWFTTNRVEMYCGSFNANPAGRASIMLHEATHIIYWDLDHQPNNPGSNCGTTPCSDNWYFHLLGEYPYGQLAGHKHSMNQMEIEFLCDLGEFADDRVPASLAIWAASESRSLMDNRILQPPAWTCGLPRPVPAEPPPPPLCPTGKKCCDPPTPPDTHCDCIPASASCP